MCGEIPFHVQRLDVPNALWECRAKPFYGISVHHLRAEGHRLVVFPLPLRCHHRERPPGLRLFLIRQDLPVHLPAGLAPKGHPSAVDFPDGLIESVGPLVIFLLCHRYLLVFSGGPCYTVPETSRFVVVAGWFGSIRSGVCSAGAAFYCAFFKSLIWLVCILMMLFRSSTSSSNASTLLFGAKVSRIVFWPSANA